MEDEVAIFRICSAQQTPIVRINHFDRLKEEVRNESATVRHVCSLCEPGSRPNVDCVGAGAEANTDACARQGVATVARTDIAAQGLQSPG
jgi:hypothetical protein